MASAVAVTRKRSRNAGPVSPDRLAATPRAAAQKRAKRRSGQRTSGLGDGDGLLDRSDDAARDAIVPFTEVRPQVLLVDDDRSLCLALRSPMQQLGIDLLPAHTPDEARHFLSSRSFDVAVLDWKLNCRGCDGMDLLREIKADYPSLPVVFFTGYGSPEVQLECHHIGAEAYVAKDGIEELCPIVKELASGSRSRGVWLALDNLLTSRKKDFALLGKYARKAIAEICVYLHQNHTVASLSDAAGCKSEGYFAHVFKNAVGLSPMAFLKRLRVERAKLLLRDADFTHDTIAERVGFGSPATMRKAFKKIEGRPPSDFRDALEC